MWLGVSVHAWVFAECHTRRVPPPSISLEAHHGIGRGRVMCSCPCEPLGGGGIGHWRDLRAKTLAVVVAWGTVPTLRLRVCCLLLMVCAAESRGCRDASPTS